MALIPKSSRSGTLDRPLRAIVENVENLETRALSKGVIVRGVYINGNGQRIFHGLGRVPIGYYPVRRGLDLNGIWNSNFRDVTQPEVDVDPKNYIKLLGIGTGPGGADGATYDLLIL